MGAAYYQTTAEPFHNGHLEDRRKWPLQRGLNKSQCMGCPPKKVAVVEKWPLVEVRLFQQSMRIFVGELVTCERMRQRVMQFSPGSSALSTVLPRQDSTDLKFRALCAGIAIIHQVLTNKKRRAFFLRQIYPFPFKFLDDWVIGFLCRGFDSLDLQHTFLQFLPVFCSDL